jgi:hypothetical protein
MSWGKHLMNVNDDTRLLYWSLLWAISPMSNRPVDYFLARILGPEGRAAADPGWEIEKIVTERGQQEFYIWLDPDIYLMQPNEGKFPLCIFQEAVKNTLLEYAAAYPEKKGEFEKILLRYEF